MKKRAALFNSVIALILCVAMLAGSTFAWFTDSSVSTGNIIKSGKLDLEVYWAEDLNGTWNDVENVGTNKIFDYKYWEPGYTQVRYIKIVNAGDLAFRYALEIKPNGEVSKLADVIDVYAAETIDGRADLTNPVGTLRKAITGDITAKGELTEGEVVLAIALKMREDAGNEYQNLSIGDSFGITINATQYTYEEDSFGDDYDTDAALPGLKGDATGSTDVETSNGVTTAETTITTNTDVKATVPAGVKVEDGKLSLSVTAKDGSDSNITAGEGENLAALDVHIDGVASDNTTPILVELGAILAEGFNQGNMALYHVENGTPVPMTQVLSLSELDAHNEYYYDPATGIVTLAMATFSEVAVVATEEAKWEGKFDYTWYTNAVAPVDGEAVTEYTIANADQLAAFGAIVGGMNGQTQDSFKDKTVKLISDINLGDKESENNPNLIFYPIGYYNSEGTYERTNTAITSGLRNFEGTFDGNGHTIANFYHNTWEMKGDHDWYSPQEQYYRDGMGLFGRVYKGTVKNLTVDNFSSDGEIATTGVIAAYADGATFENIAVFNCNPRVYNIGNGGIVGCVGWYAKEKDLKTTFKNITVDNSNKISALWGSYDVACGGIVGQYYPTSGQSSYDYPVNAGIHFENCHVSAQMDVYNDVCANYQYYAYRYTGMLIGSVRENVTDKETGHVYPKMDGITAENCTVHFGTWNDYYYCEIIDNTTASYTHDYQMSRLTEIKAIDGTTITYLDGTTGTVPASGRANYVIVDYTKGHGTGNATCYHFKDGAVWTHDMGGIQTGIDENGDGQDDLKEDKQHIYLEFNNLVTGYGWGVTSKGVDDLDGVTILDREVGNSVEKFTGKVTELANNKEYKLGDIFSFVNNGVELVPGALTVTVTNMDDSLPVSATIVYDRENWENGTITFTGTGKVTITIQDYYFCTPTEIEVTITARQPEVKFNKLFTNTNFTYRVGNANTVALGSLFKAKAGTEIGTVSVTVENVTGNATGTYTSTSNATWTNGTVQFSGTGVVKVTITDNDYCTPTVLNLEVVEAKNATSATSATANNVVLLNDCGFSTLEVSGGYALYGNGFTMTCSSDSPVLDMGYSFVKLANGTLDNVQIVCPNYDYAALYKEQLTSDENRSKTTDKTRYYNAMSGVMASGNSQILNSRISGGRAAVNVSNGTLFIDNSRLELGAVASLLVNDGANKVVLRDVTLVQKPTVSTYDSSKTLMGLSVLFLCNSEGNAAPVTIEGNFIQYAWADSSCSAYMPSGTEGIASAVLGKDAYKHTINDKTCANLGFAYMPTGGATVNQPSNITDNRTDAETIPYAYESVKASVQQSGFSMDVSTYVYSYKNTNGTADAFKAMTEYVPNKYSDVVTVSYSDSREGLTSGKSYGSDGWIYELNVDLDKLPGYALDFSKLSMSVNGVAVIDFKVDGNAKPTTSVPVTTGGTTYTLTATVDGKEHEAIFKVTGTETSKESPSLVGTPSYGAGFGVANSYGGDWSAAAPVLDGITIKYWSVADSEYKEFALSSITFASTGKQNGTNNYWEYTHTNNDFTLKLTNTTPIHSNSGTYGMPVAGKDGKLYFTISGTGGFVSTGTTSRSITIAYEFTDNNGGETLTFSHTWSIPYSKDEQYNYNSFVADGTKTKLESCLVEGTLITMADGTQKPVEDLVVGDMILVFNHVSGKYEAAPLIFNTHSDQTEAKNYDVLCLQFSDGKELKIAASHGLFDMTLMKYVYVDYDNYQEFIGHEFYAMGDDGSTGEKIELVNAFIRNEKVRIFCPVTYFHMNSFANGLLNTPNIPGGITGLVNYFEYDPDLKYNEEAMQRDIEKYGLYTYEDFSEYISEAAYLSSPAVYLKVAVGKGMITYEQIIDVIRYLLAGSLIQ